MWVLIHRQGFPVRVTLTACPPGIFLPPSLSTQRVRSLLMKVRQASVRVLGGVESSTFICLLTLLFRLCHWAVNPPLL